MDVENRYPNEAVDSSPSANNTTTLPIESHPAEQVRQLTERHRYEFNLVNRFFAQKQQKFLNE
jgi:DNA-dependent RNA polymerase auxiliary subunit epsilon